MLTGFVCLSSQEISLGLGFYNANSKLNDHLQRRNPMNTETNKPFATLMNQTFTLNYYRVVSFLCFRDSVICALERCALTMWEQHKIHESELIGLYLLRCGGRGHVLPSAGRFLVGDETMEGCFLLHYVTIVS